MEKFKFLEHTADVKFQAFGKNMEEKFINSALALKETITGNIVIKSKINKKILIKGKDEKSLLYNFLEEFLYLLDAERFLVNKIRNLTINEKNFELKALIAGDDASNYKFTNSVKAITYNDMMINKKFIQVVLDV